MTDEILKHLAELKHEYECAASAGLSDTPLKLTEALRFAVERLGQIKKHWGVICGESRPNSLKSPMTVILENAEEEISKILGVDK